jgi:hypothetical protein
MSARAAGTSTFAIGGQQFIALAVGSNIVCFGIS